MKAALALLALAALVASAHATCYCDQLKYISGSSTCPIRTAVVTPPTGFTYTAGNPTSTTGGSCTIIYVDNTKSLQDIADGCTGTCKGFSIFYVNTGFPSGSRLQYCYYSGTLPTVNTPPTDARCYGVYAKIPVVVTPPTDCCNKYTGGARDKCIGCISNNKFDPAVGPNQCCSCPVTTLTDTTNCIDCTVTAAIRDKPFCPLCLGPYTDGTNGYIRCLECVKLANGRPALNPAPRMSFTSQADQCVKFCSAKHLPDPTECLDCTKDGLAANFMIPMSREGVVTNPNGQCPSSGRKQL